MPRDFTDRWFGLFSGVGSTLQAGGSLVRTQPCPPAAPRSTRHNAWWTACVQTASCSNGALHEGGESPRGECLRPWPVPGGSFRRELPDSARGHRDERCGVAHRVASFGHELTRQRAGFFRQTSSFDLGALPSAAQPRRSVIDGGITRVIFPGEVQGIFSASGGSAASTITSRPHRLLPPHTWNVILSSGRAIRPTPRSDERLAVPSVFSPRK